LKQKTNKQNNKTINESLGLARMWMRMKGDLLKLNTFLQQTEFKNI